jgi:hypothetical protein
VRVKNGWTGFRDFAETELLQRPSADSLRRIGVSLFGAIRSAQPRTYGASPASELVSPVSCVEQGRWSAVSAAFCASPRVQFAAGRAAKVASVSDRLAQGQGAVSDQGEV